MRREGLSDEAVIRALDGAPDAVVLFTAGGRILYANDAVAAVFGWTPSELLGLNVADLVHPEDIDVALASVAAFDEQGPRARTPAMMRFKWPDGSYATLDVNGNPITTSDGRTLYSMFGRRVEEQRIMRDTIQMLAEGYDDLETVFGVIHEHMRWAIDQAVTVFAWEDEDGVRHQLGDDVAPELSGSADEELDGDAPSPWVLAWKGEDAAGPTAELPVELRERAEATSLRSFRIHPVTDDLGRVRVLVTLWDDDTGHPLPVFENRLAFVSRLLQLTLRFDEQQRRLQHDVSHDSLTGLANRRAFFGALHDADEARGSGPTAVLYIDLDGFKPINDEHGHGAGDRVLVAVASRLRAACRSDDTVARIGGDEFAVVCPGADTEHATAIAERFLDALDEPIDIGGHGAVVGASVGAAVGPSGASEALAAAADHALYEAKHAGGRRFVIATER